MKYDEVYLTPAEQMQRIREVVNSSDVESSDKAYALLVNSFSRMDALRKRITQLESKMLIKEQPFVSHAPIVGPLIVMLRTFWNWMSTKWYLFPLIPQQNAYNMAATQTLREMLVTMEALSSSLQDLQVRVAALEKGNDASSVNPSE